MNAPSPNIACSSTLLHYAIVAFALAAGVAAPHSAQGAVGMAPPQDARSAEPSAQDRAGETPKQRTQSKVGASEASDPARSDTHRDAQRDERNGMQQNRAGERDDTVNDPNTEMEDAMITARVKAALLADGDVGGLGIDVDTVQGVVRLKGEVDDQREIDEARRLAEAVDGVRRVATDDLRTKSSGRRDTP